MAKKRKSYSEKGSTQVRVPGVVGQKHSPEELKRRNFLLAGLAGAAVIGGGGYILNDTMRPLGLDADDAIREYWIGSQNADVRMIAYVSYTCQYCASFHQATWPGFKRDYVDSRKIKYTLREVLFNKYDLWASMLARGFGRQGYFGFADELLARQSDWVAADAELTQANLRYLALRHGMSEDRINAILSDETGAEILAGWSERNQDRDQVTSTPTLIIAGRKYGNLQYTEMKNILDKAIG